MNINTVDIYYRMAIDGLNAGGATFERDAHRTAHLPGRFIVAIGSPHAAIVEAKAENLGGVARALRALADDRTAWPKGGMGRALGLWVSDGLMYIDVVDSHYHGGYALRVARDRDQLAIFDNQKGVDIAVT